jgi:hypothetical protein
MDDMKFIKEMMDFRYSSNVYPVYKDYLNSKDKMMYLGLAKQIKENKDKGMYRDR